MKPFRHNANELKIWKVKKSLEDLLRKQKTYENCIVECAREGIFEGILKCIELIAKPKNIIQRSLEAAVQNNHLDIVKYFIEKYSIIYIDYEKLFSLAKEFSIIEYLAETSGESWPKIIKFVAQNGQLEIVKMIISLDNSTECILNGIHSSSDAGKVNVFRYLMDNFNSNSSRICPIKISFSCLSQSHFDIFEICMEKEIPLYYRYVHILSQAILRGKYQLIQYMVSHTSKLVKDNLTPADIYECYVDASRKKEIYQNLDAVKCFAPHLKSEHFNNALIMCTENGSREVFEYLMELNPKRSDDRYYLMNALYSHNLSVFKYLVELGVSLEDIPDLNICIDDPYFIQYLIGIGVNFNLANCLNYKLIAHSTSEIIKFFADTGLDLSELYSTILYKFGVDVIKYILSKSCEDIINWSDVSVVKYLLQDEEFRKNVCFKFWDDDTNIVMHKLVIRSGIKPPIEIASRLYRAGIIYDESGLTVMQMEYEKVQKFKLELKTVIYEAANNILMRPGGLRMLLVESEFGNEHKSEAYRYMD